MRLPGRYATVRWQIWQRVTGSWVTVTGKRREGDLLICLYDARPAGVILHGAHTALTPRGMSGCLAAALAQMRRLLNIRPVLLVRVIINDMAYCELCEMDREFCEHGLAERDRNAAASTGELLISPSGEAHFPGCPHKGGDPDYSPLGGVATPRAWERLGSGEQLHATGGERPDLTARTRCQDRAGHGLS